RKINPFRAFAQNLPCVDHQFFFQAEDGIRDNSAAATLGIYAFAPKMVTGMISALTGELHRVDDDRIQVRVGPLLYEMLVPAADLALLQAGLGQEMTFHTIFYIEGDASGGNLEPRLIGFLRPE